MLTNIRSIRNEVAEFQHLIDQHKPAIIGVTQSWCDSKITDAEISLPSYSLYRKDRSTGTGGGVLLYIHESLSATPVLSLNNVGF